MKIENLPEEIRDILIPKPVAGTLEYRCLGCSAKHGVEKLLYTCPECGEVLLIHDRDFDRLKRIPGEVWRELFDYRRMLKIPAVKGIYLYHEFIGPIIPLDSVVWLGEGHTPMVEANEFMRDLAGLRFFFKNDGQNPSASFKDRGMASALSYINWLINTGRAGEILAVCASTGDTSAAAALYASYLGGNVSSSVLLPHKKVTPQQLSQPLGSGAAVFEIPGVFDDCMKVVEALSMEYNVALLNSKNAWRVLGQESYSYEIAQDFDYDMKDVAVIAPIGNAGNITAIMSGFIKFYQAGVIETLPKIIGVQSAHANPVYKYYLEPDASKRRFEPVKVRASVAQAAMIGNPVSMPRVVRLGELYNELAGKKSLFVVEVAEQEIMDMHLTANRNGHIACTQGGESLAGLMAAKARGIVGPDEVAVLDSTAHALKFSGFMNMYFEDSFPEEFGIKPKKELCNRPVLVPPDDENLTPGPGRTLRDDEFGEFVKQVSAKIAGRLGLKRRTDSL